MRKINQYQSDKNHSQKTITIFKYFKPINIQQYCISIILFFVNFDKLVKKHLIVGSEISCLFNLTVKDFHSWL